MTDKPKTLDEVRAALKSVVEDYGEDTTAPCVYVRGSQPVCIAAVTLDKLGYSRNSLNKLAAGVWIEYTQRSESDLSNFLTDRAAQYLDKAQEVQDNRDGKIVGFYADGHSFADGHVKNLDTMTVEEKEKVNWGAAYRAAEDFVMNGFEED